jgi:FMN-dependent NADH-azoreductase
MKRILHIISSPMGEVSSSTKLGNKIIEQLLHRYPGSIVTVNNVAEEKYMHLGSEQIEAYHTPVPDYTPDHISTLQPSDTAVQELENTDIVVISLPVYNFSLPSALKAWIDHIVRAGKTFSYGSGQPEGLLQNKKAYLAISSGGVYSDGPMKPFDFAEPYLRFILGFIGISDISTYRVEGVGVSGVKNALEKGLTSVAV